MLQQKPVLFEITDTGHLELIHQVVMKDEPLRLKISKNIITGGKEVAGASMGIYPVDENGEVSKTPLVLHIPEENGCYRDEKAVWISGMDGAYTQEEMEKGRYPMDWNLETLSLIRSNIFLQVLIF